MLNILPRGRGLDTIPDMSQAKTNVMRILDAHHVPYLTYSYIGTGAQTGADVLKRAAMAVGEKSVDMLKSRDLLPLTGYIHGGCSPIGMKKQFQTVVDSSAQNFTSIIFSAGRVGAQVQIAVSDLVRLVPLSFCDVVVSHC